jgi:hypothetical protein
MTVQSIFQNREVATILAALRFYQREMRDGLVPYCDAEYFLLDIASDGNTEVMLSADEIDDLCEKINFDRRL